MKRLMVVCTLAIMAGCGGDDAPDVECGNGTVDTGEQCDDSNTVSGDGCSATCQTETAPVCGDGTVDTGEQCDDGNTTAGDGCSATCQTEPLADCGNSIVETGEACDDGNTVQTDACLNDCTAAACGDGITHVGTEDCDDGNAVDTDGCVAGCVYASCGDGFTEAGAEDCDDANTVQTDACLNDCSAASCGDGVLQAGVDTCDDGNTVQTDGCLNDCSAASCGDGFVESGVEGCDDGNGINGDGCDSNCVPTGCGNGIVTGTEECDDANTVNGDGCSAGCVIEFCGDGIRQGAEACDDGNNIDGDCCSAVCALEIVPGFECEPNDTIAIANDFDAIQVGNVVHAYITPVGDVDMFRFVVVGAGNQLTAESLAGIAGTPCVAGAGGIDTRFRLLDATGTELAAHDDGMPAQGWCSGFDMPIAAGTYYLAVDESPLPGPSDFDYDVSIFVAPVACGNDVAQGAEACDGTDLNGQTCASQPGGFGGGTLSCNATCSGFDTSACVPNVCGDGVRAGAETCDGADVGGVTCEGLGFGPGTVGCNATCDAFDTSACATPVCGDGVLQSGTEQCDPPAMGFDTCESQGFGSGTLGCTAATCQYDTSACVPYTCGNNVAEPAFPPPGGGTGEACDGTDLRGQTCTSFGLSGAGLACLADCTALDTTACTAPVCGDGTINAGEQCDDGNLVNGDGCSATCQLESAVSETEPNEDGTPSTGGMGTNGNDFSSVNANGPYSADTFISAAFTPVGDEDVFAVTNPGVAAVSVIFETYGPGGVGTCGPGLDTVLRIRNAAGTSLAFDDDSGVDFCSLLTYSIPAGTTVYVHASEFNDDATVAQYYLQISFP